MIAPQPIIHDRNCVCGYANPGNPTHCELCRKILM